MKMKLCSLIFQVLNGRNKGVLKVGVPRVGVVTETPLPLPQYRRTG